MLSKTKVKYIQSLSQKKVRDEHQVFVIEGPKIVEEFLTAARFQVLEIYALKSWLEAASQLLTNFYPERIFILEPHELERISGLTTPNQVLAVVSKFEVTNNRTYTGIWTLMLDNIQDPGNLGTIIRTADWFGLQLIVCSETCTDMYNPKVVQSTMGSLLRVNIIYNSLKALIRQNPSVPIYAATLQGESVFQIKNLQPGYLIIGNESKGISEELLTASVRRVTIPGAGHTESLNAAVATGIILSHFLKS